MAPLRQTARRAHGERGMTRCAFGCIHCGKCGPASAEGMVRTNPPGYCAFCRVQNAADAAICVSCGKPLPRAPGIAQVACADPGGALPASGATAALGAAASGAAGGLREREAGAAG